MSETPKLTLRAPRPQRQGSHLVTVVTASLGTDVGKIYRVTLDDEANLAAVADDVVSRFDGATEGREAILQDLRNIASPDFAHAGSNGHDASQTDQVVVVAEHSIAELFHDEMDEPYARVTVGAHLETWPLVSQRFDQWLTQEVRRVTGESPRKAARAEALDVLAARALFDGACHPVYVRSAPDGAGGFYYDLCDADWRAVHVTATGWIIVTDPPVFFRRSPGQRPLPDPERGSSLDDLRRFLNLPKDDAWVLVKAWLVAVLRDRGPYPILTLLGEHGATKTTAGRVLRALIDPAKPTLRAMPDGEDDLAVAARNGWLVAYDNVSHIPPWLSDALCRLSTGMGWGTRRHYKHYDEALFEACRPSLLTGITDVVVRGDLLDRVIPVIIPPLDDSERLTEEAFWTTFNEVQPKILGALFDSAVGAVRERPHVAIERPPRMADFAYFAVAAERGREEPARFLTAYAATRAGKHDQALDSCLIGPALQTVLDTITPAKPWTGTANDLLEKLNGEASEEALRNRGWPATPRALSSELRRLAPALRHLGFDVVFPEDQKREGGTGARRLTISRRGPAPTTSDDSPHSGPDDAPDDRAGAHADAGVHDGAEIKNVFYTPSQPSQRHSSPSLGRETTDSTRKSPVQNAPGCDGIPVVPPSQPSPRPSQTGTIPDSCDGLSDGCDGRGIGCDGAPAGTPSQISGDGDADSRVNPASVSSSESVCGGCGGCDGAAETLFFSATAHHVRPSLDLPPVHLLSTPDAVQQALPALAASPVLGVDIETTGDGEGDALDPITGRIRLVQLATPGAVYIVDCAGVDPRLLEPVFASGPVLLGHNLGFDLAFLQQAGLSIPTGERLFDTMLAAQLLSASAEPPPSHKLNDVVERFLAVRLDKSEQTSDWSGTLSPEQVAYAARDAAILLPLHERLSEEVRTAGLIEVAHLEMRCLPAVVWLELTGAPFDAAAWETLSTAAKTEEVRLELAMQELLGSEINVRSTPQLQRALQDRGHAVTSTDADTLRRLVAAGDPVAALLLRYREASRRASTYGSAFLANIHPVTGRIHTDYRQLGSTAGRMSSAHPCLQNIPRDDAYRGCFRPAPGRVLVKADYAGIELRLAAEMAGDAAMIDAFERGEDLHERTAQQVLGKAGDKAARKTAKMLNFAMLYGCGPETLRQRAAVEAGVSLSLREARTLQKRFFATYRGLARWHKRHQEPWGRRTPITTRTVLGRRRLDVASFTEKLNTPVQGSGADGLKEALALLWETRDRVPSAVPVLCIHDEVVIEVDESEAEAAKEWLTDCMTRGLQTVLHTVRVVVEASIRPTWADPQE